MHQAADPTAAAWHVGKVRKLRKSYFASGCAGMSQGGSRLPDHPTMSWGAPAPQTSWEFSGGLRPPGPPFGGSAAFAEVRLRVLKRDSGNQICAPPGSNLIFFFVSDTCHILLLSHLLLLSHVLLLSHLLWLSHLLLLSQLLIFSHMLLLSHALLLSHLLLSSHPPGHEQKPRFAEGPRKTRGRNARKETKGATLW